MSAGKVSVALGALLVGLFLLGCGDFSPNVGPLRDAAGPPDCGTIADEYSDAGTCTGN